MSVVKMGIEGGISESASTYHGVLAVKCSAAGFRGINGRRPRADAGPLHLFHGPLRSTGRLCAP